MTGMRNKVAIAFAIVAGLVALGTWGGMSIPASPPPGAPPSNKNGIDIDLATMNRTMVYSQVFEMLSNPSRYRGKRVRMAGTYATFEDSEGGKRYHACIISDAMACCAQGIEFAPTNAVVYPRDFPAVGTPIVVQGVFETYKERGERFVHVRNAILSVR